MGRQCRTGTVQAVGAAADDVTGGFAGADGRDKFALDAAYVAVEDGLGLSAEGRQCVFAKAWLVEERLVGVDVVEFLPMQQEFVGGDAFGMGNEEAEEGALDGIEAHRDVDSLVGQQEFAPSLYRFKGLECVSPGHRLSFFCKVRPANLPCQAITSL